MDSALALLQVNRVHSGTAVVLVRNARSRRLIGATGEIVIPVVTPQHVLCRPTVNGVIAKLAEECVGLAQARYRVVSTPAQYRVLDCCADQGVVLAGPTFDLVPAYATPATRANSKVITTASLTPLRIVYASFSIASITLTVTDAPHLISATSAAIVANNTRMRLISVPFH